MNYTRVNISDFIGKRFTKVEHIDNDMDEQSIMFHCVDGSVYRMYHDQSCCEHVYLADICGDFSDLVDAEIFDAREDSKEQNHDDGSEGWTFYNIRSSKGTVTLRWNGSSNGYYSIDCNIYLITLPENMVKIFHDGYEQNPFHSISLNKGSRVPFGYLVSVVFKNGQSINYNNCSTVQYNIENNGLSVTSMKYGSNRHISGDDAQYIYISNDIEEIE